MAEKRGTSPWVYVGCGCAAVVLLVIGGLGAVGFFGVRMAKDIGEGFSDPAVREERAKEVLGTEQLPEGYRAQFHLQIPFMIDMVMLSDGAEIGPEAAGSSSLSTASLGENAFVYIEMRDVGNARRDFEGLLEGEARKLENVELPVDFRSRELLGQGELEVAPQTLRYAVHRGEYRDEGRPQEGFYAVLLIDCPASSKLRLAYRWQRKDVASTQSAQAEALSDTAAAEETGLDLAAYESDLAAFVGHFDLCSG